MIDTEFEHIIHKDRKFWGLRFVDTDKLTGLDLWSKVDTIVRDYSELHPNEMKLQLEYNKAVRESRYNQLGSNKSKTLRWGLSIPMGLAFKIQSIQPDFFENKKTVNKFMRRYKGFRTCQVV